MTLKDCSETALSKLEWLYGNLIKQKEDEQKVYEKAVRSGRTVEWQKKY